ncbi:MAG TPA: hypothetical protein VL549_08780 [Gemmatimonadales bacterium]|jgi:hypothetical protein|nr:hypothetical protein [Gemmatimonadales bacterium]
MRLLKRISALLLTFALTASHTVMAAVQDAKIEVNTHQTHGAWYTQPVWIAIGIIAVVLLVVLISMAGRGRSNTTVVK